MLQELQQILCKGLLKVGRECSCILQSNKGSVSVRTTTLLSGHPFNVEKFFSYEEAIYMYSECAVQL